MTPAKEREIQKGCPGSHPREKRIMERIFYLLRMSVQLIFVFDGPNKPWKHRPMGQNYSELNVALLKELLDHLGVPRHDAPGEAEAECARLQELGVVDAVWSDDSDTFMFGCTTLVQFHKPEGSEDTVLTYTADSLVHRSGLTREGLVMYAILVGCDYSKGLASFGSSALLTIAKHDAFQETARILTAAAPDSRLLSKWRAMLLGMVKAKLPSKNFGLPPKTFPDPKILKSCCLPNVSSDIRLKGLVTHWFRPFGPNMPVLYQFLLDHFHSRRCRSWPAGDLVPIELNHRLRERATSQLISGPDYGIAEKTGVGPKKETTLTVDPLLIIPELLRDFPPYWLNQHTGLPPEFKKVKVTILDCIVRKGLPHVKENAGKGVFRGRGRPKKAIPQDQTINDAASHDGQGDKSPKAAIPPIATSHRSKAPKKRTWDALKETDDLSGLNSKNKPKIGTAILAESANKTGHNRGTLERRPAIAIDDDDEENRHPNEHLGHELYKKRRVVMSLSSDITVVDLTEAD